MYGDFGRRRMLPRVRKYRGSDAPESVEGHAGIVHGPDGQRFYEVAYARPGPRCDHDHVGVVIGEETSEDPACVRRHLRRDECAVDALSLIHI